MGLMVWTDFQKPRRVYAERPIAHAKTWTCQRCGSQKPFFESRWFCNRHQLSFCSGCYPKKELPLPLIDILSPFEIAAIRRLWTQDFVETIGKRPGYSEGTFD